MNFKDVKKKVIEDLLDGNFSHEARNQIDEKNLLQVGQIDAVGVVEILKRCRGQNHRQSPHHQCQSIDVHVILVNGWYIKFYIVESTTFISVHKEERARK